MNEIERKFLVTNIPDLSKYEKVTQERFYIFISESIQLRVQRKGTKYEIERKTRLSDLSRTMEKMAISKEEYEALKSNVTDVIERDSYLLSNNPKVSVKIYHGKQEGLVRAEIEFESEEEAQTFVPYDWFGEEITNKPEGKDATLMTM